MDPYSSPPSAIPAAPVEFQPIGPADWAGFADPETAAISQLVPAALFLLDEQRRICRLNRVAQEMTGRSPEEALGTVGGTLLGCLNSLDDPRGCGYGPACAQCPLRRAVQETFDTGRGRFGLSVSPKVVAGQQVETMRLVVSTTRLELGGRPYVLLCLQDTSEQTRLAEELRQAQKVLTLGHLAGGIAHDFNNILTAILMQFGALQWLPGIDEAHRRSLGELEEEVRRAAHLNRQLLSYGRPTVFHPVSLDLAEVIEQLSTMLRRLLGRHLALRVESPPALPPVEGDRGMVEQVVVNLVLNARDAQPGGGTITIGLDSCHFSPESPPAHPDGQYGDFLCLRVRDAGCGIRPELREHLFEPFFTTKPEGQGAGLGLVTVRRIVERHGGWIEVESEVGRGSEFRVFLRRASTPAAVPGAAARTPDRSRGTERLWVIDGHDQARRQIQLLLQVLGYRVTEFSEITTAWSALDNGAEHPHLLILDDDLGESGPQVRLLERLRRQLPDLRVIVTTGGTPAPARHPNIWPSGTVLLPKPFSATRLTEAIRQALAAR